MLKILVVDDSKLARKRVISSLENSSIDCEVVAYANDGKDGLDAYIKHRPNLVITDIEMPNMDGKEFVENLKKLKNDLQVLVITSVVNEKTKIELMQNEGVYVLHKPLQQKLLNIFLEKIKNQLHV